MLKSRAERKEGRSTRGGMTCRQNSGARWRNPTSRLQGKPTVMTSKRRIITGWALTLAVALLPGAPANAGGPSDFEQLVKPYLEDNCTRCHGSKKQKGKLTLHTITDQFKTEAGVERWIEVLNMLSFEEMPPPEEEKQPDPLATARIVDWIKQRLHEAGKADAYLKKLLAPEYGNWVSHEKLFSGEIKTPPFSPSRLWRLSPAIFKQQGFGRAQSPFTYVTPETGIRDYAAMSAVDQSTVQTILINVGQYLEDRQRRGEFKRFADGQPSPPDQVLTDTVRAEFRRVIGREANLQEQSKYVGFLQKNIAIGGNTEGLITTIKTMFLSPEAIYRMEFGLGKKDRHGRRHLSPREIAHTLSYALTDRGPEHTPALKKALAEGKLAEKEEVAKVIREVLDQELATGHWSRRRLPRIMRFFEEYFGFDRAGSVFKDNERKSSEGIPQWNTDMLIHDARMLIEYHLKRDQDVIAELLTTDQYFVAHPGDNRFAREFYDERIAEYTAAGYVSIQVAKKKEELDRQQEEWNHSSEERKKRLDQARQRAELKVTHVKTALKKGLNPHPNFPFSDRSRGIADLIYIEPYNLPSSGGASLQRWQWPIAQPFEMPGGQRAGLLTHPAWLATHSLNDGNDPIRRGIWIREKLLAGVIQDVPPDVDANIPPDPHKTLRERLDILREERCWTCHRKINPLGEAFEIFDDWGRYRSKVYFDEENKLLARRDAAFDRKLAKGTLTARPINASGAITGSGDPRVDGEVQDAIELMHRLGRSGRARQSFIRYLFRYFMGRNEMLSDSKTLIEAEQAYLENGGSFKALVVSLLGSDSFLYRR